MIRSHNISHIDFHPLIKLGIVAMEFLLHFTLPCNDSCKKMSSLMSEYKDSGCLQNHLLRSSKIII